MKPIPEELIQLLCTVSLSAATKDEKAIADASLIRDECGIIADYHSQKDNPAFSLQLFFDNNFSLPPDKSCHFVANNSHTPTEHIEALWPHLRRQPDSPESSTLIPLPYSYVVPGGRFREMYYWDSYFTMLGLLASGKFEWVEDMLKNFAYLIQTFGHIPNGNRHYYTSRSQPPFFAHMVVAYADSQITRRVDILKQYLPFMKIEYNYWQNSERTCGYLSHYHDDHNLPRVEMYRTDLRWQDELEKQPNFYRNVRAACESGWDFSSRWLTNQQEPNSIAALDILPIDLNCLLLFYEELLGQLTGDSAYIDSATHRKAAIHSQLFDPNSGFHDFNHQTQTLMTEVHSAAALYPLFVRAATPQQATVVSKQVEQHLLQRGGITATNIESGEQWDAPNGWAPLHWVAVCGLRNYGFDELAETIATRWLRTCEDVFNSRGKFVEKYNVCAPTIPAAGGEYENQDGFGWTIGVYLALKSMYPSTS